LILYFYRVFFIGFVERMRLCGDALLQQLMQDAGNPLSGDFGSSD
jgi:hypothetical protein